VKGKFGCSQSRRFCGFKVLRGQSFGQIHKNFENGEAGAGPEGGAVCERGPNHTPSTCLILGGGGPRGGPEKKKHRGGGTWDLRDGIKLGSGAPGTAFFCGRTTKKKKKGRFGAVIYRCEKKVF